MGDSIPNTMNLDLNLGPVESPTDDSEPVPASFPIDDMNLEDLLDGYRFREVVRQRRSRWRSALRNIPVPAEARNIAMEFIGRSEPQTSDVDVVPEERPTEVENTCDNNNGYLNDEILGKKEDNEKGNSEEGGSFFDCNICLDLSKEPVVTCCGHLFCWPCLYRWLHLHSDAKECPVCKGEVTMKNVIPIYGRGTGVRDPPEEDSNLKIPHRPQARRVESWRQTIQRTAFTIPMEEMIRRLGNRFDLSQLQQNNPEGSHELPERSSSLLNRILTSRGLRREQNPVIPSDDVVDLTQTSPTNSDVWESRRLSSLLLRRSNSHRAANYANIASAFGSGGRLVEPYFRGNTVERNQEQQPLPVDDRDSVSSIAAVIHSESQTVDTAAEIDSRVSLSTSSSRRRNDASRISDVDSGDSRAPRRRRLN
ncbi:uncharacterized protein LOC132049163 [Lycium ferocissimum]|uniref:uncharacterized protein LOC132049163 n=1 Tax=Lycium ferocissimum TaxID=112874 RepID=UPI0028160913|nr:uncharacterized protein LOC132049163 [Lycium ferocissimum]